MQSSCAFFTTGLATLLTLFASPGLALTVGFEDVGANLPIAGDFFYSGESAYDPADPDATDFVSGGAVFNNDFDPFFAGCCWQGFAYSQTTDTTNGGVANQYSAKTGRGAGGSATYAVAFTGGSLTASDIVTITFGSELSVLSAQVTNTTYAWDSMRNGDGFAKQFGGASGDDPDFLQLVVTGFDTDGFSTGSVDFYLADYRFADNGLDYILTDWTTLDLSSLGAVKSLDFKLVGSDAEFGFLNTPSYFALDDLVVVPEPGSAGLLALGLALLSRRRRRSNHASRTAPAALARGTLGSGMISGSTASGMPLPLVSVGGAEFTAATASRSKPALSGPDGPTTWSAAWTRT